MRLFRNVAGLLLGIALLAAVAVAQNEEPSLGDVARQQSGKKATKSFDDDNFQRTAPPPAADTKGAESGKADAAAKADAKGGDKADAAPSDDVKALEKQLADLKRKREITNMQIARLQSSMENAQGDVRDSLAQNLAVYKETLDNLNAQVPGVEKQLEAARAAQKPDSGADEEDSKPGDSKPEPVKPDDKSK